MAIWVKRYCSKCRSDLTEWRPEEKDIGEPFITCGVCGTDNDQSETTTEWDLRSNNQKVKLVITNLISAIVFGIFLPLFGYILLRYFVFSIEVVWLVAAVLLCSILFVILVLTNLKKAIRNSRRKMLDKAYRYNLVILGYMPLDNDLNPDHLSDLRNIRNIFKKSKWDEYALRSALSRNKR